MKPPFKDIPRIELAGGFDESLLKNGWAIGGYNEKRDKMYTAPQYRNERNIHMGIDIWAPVGEPVYAPADGIVAYNADNSEEGNYGGTVVLKHSIKENDIFALYGHLSLSSLEKSCAGDSVKAGDVVGWLGNRSENGNWHPHLHYQLCTVDPGEADMPGVVSEKERKSALLIYPDPEEVFGKLV